MPEILIGVAVDIVVKRENSWLAGLGFSNVLDQLLILGLLTFLAFSIESVLQFLYQVKWRNLAQALQHAMRMDCYNHVQKLDISFFEDKSTGNLLSIMNDDVNQLERFLDGGANALIQVLTSSLLIGAIFFYISPLIALAALAPMPLILFGAFRFQTMLGPRYAKVRESAGLISARLSNNLLGMLTIRSYGAENIESENLGQDSMAYQAANQKAIKLSSAYIPIIRMAIVAGFISTLVFGGYYTLLGKIEVASYSILVFLTQRLLWPFTRLAEMTDLYQRAMASADRVLDLLSTPITIKDGKTSIAAIKKEISFKEIFFAYGERTKIIENLNLNIKAGSTVAIVGATGSGKSTIVKLLMRFYSPQSGQIAIDGQDIAQIKVSDLRKLISLVSQDVFLFSGSIKENIAYGKISATDDEIIKAAKLAEAHDFISILPQGYDSYIGERGFKLSGGQKQRLSIARAILKNAPIFILDEATSAIDNETEEAIQKSLEQITKERTTIIIAHRLSTVRHADIIYVTDQGRISQQGTHDELSLIPGQYQRLWQIQTGAISHSS